MIQHVLLMMTMAALLFPDDAWLLLARGPRLSTSRYRVHKFSSVKETARAHFQLPVLEPAHSIVGSDMLPLLNVAYVQPITHTARVPVLKVE